jgi:hypothetical protein
MAAIKTEHYINKSASHLSSGKYVPDNRYSFNFRTSTHVAGNELQDTLGQLIINISEQVQPHETCLVGHSLDGDME